MSDDYIKTRFIYRILLAAFLSNQFCVRPRKNVLALNLKKKKKHAHAVVFFKRGNLVNVDNALSLKFKISVTVFLDIKCFID